MKDFKKLTIWQKGMEIVLKAYQLAKLLPPERYGLKSQICRSAVSIPSNIAEGSAKSSAKDYKNFLEIALGASYELETQVLIVEMIGLGEKELIETLLKEVDEEQKMVQSFIKSVNP